jgi:hypothetical protein
VQVLGLQSHGITALALTSLTPKEDITAVYHRMELDEDVRLVYGTDSYIGYLFLTCPAVHTNFCQRMPCG